MKSDFMPYDERLPHGHLWVIESRPRKKGAIARPLESHNKEAVAQKKRKLLSEDWPEIKFTVELYIRKEKP